TAEADETGVADGLDGTIAASLGTWQVSPAAPRPVGRGRDRPGGGPRRRGPAPRAQARRPVRPAPGGPPPPARGHPRAPAPPRPGGPPAAARTPRRWPCSAVPSAVAGPCWPAVSAPPPAR